jgi:DNA-binding MarR family transcriptional regulator
VSDEFVALDPDRQLGYLLVVAAEQQSRAWHDALRAHGINPRQFSMLATLAHDPGISQAELARRVMVTPQSLSESLSRLLDAGLVERGHPEPGRAARLGLTTAGRALLTATYPVVEAFNRDSFAALTGSEQATLGRLLARLIAATSGK